MASFFTRPFLLSCITLSLLLQIPSYSSTYYYDQYTAYSNLYECGKIKNLGFPFWGNGRLGGCGHPDLYLTCSEGLTFITIQNVRYLVSDADPHQRTMKIVRSDYEHDLCPKQLLNTSLDPQVFEYVPEAKNLTLLYGCPSNTSLHYGQFSCFKDGYEYAYALLDNIPDIFVHCSTRVVVPFEVITSWVNPVDLIKVKGLLRDAFKVKWILGIGECDNCEEGGGVCGYNWGSNQTTFYYSKRRAQLLRGLQVRTSTR